MVADSEVADLKVVAATSHDWAVGQWAVEGWEEAGLEAADLEV